LAAPSGEDAQPVCATPESDVSFNPVAIMSNDDKLIDFSAERGKRIHDLHDKKLDEMRQAFEQALPLPKGKKSSKSKPKKR
jgi:hypothetical protein